MTIGLKKNPIFMKKSIRINQQQVTLLDISNNMKIDDFKLERYFAKYEFTAKYLLSSSDCESIPLSKLLQMADMESLQLWKNLELGYTESNGHPLLRQEITKLYHHLTSDDIIVLAPEEGIFIALNTLLNKGEHIIVTDLAYQSLQEIPKAIGCSVTRWPVHLKNNHWNIDLDFLEKNIKKETKLIVVNFPHNPTGYIPSKEDFNHIVEIARKKGIYLFADEMYRLLEFHKSFQLESVGENYEKGISLFGLSKTFGLPGLRIGWLSTRDKNLMKAFASFKDYTTICNSAPGEILGIIALRKKEKIIGRNLNRIKENISIVKDFFTKHKNLFTWIESRGSSVAFPKLNENIQVDEFCKCLIDEKSIMLLPGSVFNFKENHFRIGLGRENFKAGLNELEAYLIDYL